MKADWEVKPLGEVCEVLDRLRKPITKKDRVRGPYPYYGATGELDRVADYLFDELLVLIGEDGAKWNAGDNSAFSVSGKVWVNNHAHVIRPDRTVVSDEWLIYFLNFSDLSEFITGMTVPKLNQARMREIPIPIPPVEEQKQIVAVLDAAFEGLNRAKENAEANLQNARELLAGFTRSKMNGEAKRTRKVKLSDVCSIASKLVDPKLPEYLDLKHLGAGNMISESDDLVDVKTAREEGLISGKHPFTEFDVLYSKIRPYLKKAARPPFAGLCSADVYPLTPNKAIDRDFLFHLLMGPEFTDYAIAGSGRAGMPKVNRKHMFDFEFILPPLDEQIMIAKAIDSLRVETVALEENYTTKLTDIADLRQSLLQKAFAGELT